MVDDNVVRLDRAKFVTLRQRKWAVRLFCPPCTYVSCRQNSLTTQISVQRRVTGAAPEGQARRMSHDAGVDGRDTSP